MINFPDIRIVGLTGMSGAGKTTASSYFKENGYYVINCDAIAREVVKKDSLCFFEIVYAFPDCVTSDGELDRKKLADKVFNNKQLLLKHQSLIFPYISYAVIQRILNCKNSIVAPKILLDAPTLFESKIDDLCDTVVSVVADYDICKERILKRDTLTVEQAEARLRNQKDKAFYCSQSDYCVHNNNDVLSFFSQLDEIIQTIGRT